jgi:hypothetical protein
MMKRVQMALLIAALFAAAGSQACPDSKQASTTATHDDAARVVAKSDAAPVAKPEATCAGSDCTTATTATKCVGTNCNAAKPAAQADTKGNVATAPTR